MVKLKKIRDRLSLMYWSAVAVSVLASTGFGAFSGIIYNLPF